MEQISYPRRNIGPLTRYGRFRSSSRSSRRYTRGRRNSYIGFSRLPYRRPTVSSYSANILRIKKIPASEALSYPATAAGGAPTYYSKSFKYSDTDDYTNYSAIYDAYRIYGIHIKILPRCSPEEGGVSSGTGNQICYIAVDYDDDIPPTTQTSVRNTGTCKQFSATRPFSMFIRPRNTGALFAGAAFSGYSINQGGKRGPWVDMANPGVKYYGIKIATAGTSASFPVDSYAFDISYTYYVELRGQR